MSLIDDIRKDREAGTPGRWVFDGVFIEDNSASLVCDLLRSTHTDQQLNANARRIARVPDLEEAYLAALDALEKAEKLISGDLTGAEWKRACNDFLRTAREKLK